MSTYFRWILAIAGLIALYFLLWPRMAQTDDERKALEQDRTIIVYWDRHSGHEHEARRALIDEFNRSQDKIYVRALSVGFNASMEKLLTAIAGNAPPDLCALDGGIMWQVATQGCLMPIEDRMAAEPSLKRETFFPHCWDSIAFDGHVWGLPTTTDTYCLLWNKSAFRKAGLDPERSPQTISELSEYAAKLTIFDDVGLKQAGFIPWQPWDNSPMWGLLFGGSWYDEKAGKVVCAGDSNIRRMFDWQRSYSKDPQSNDNPPYAMDPERILSFQAGFGAYMSTNNPFYSGKLAMICEGEWQVTFIPKYAPDLDWGVAPIPTPDGCEPMAFGCPCVADCIPRGCKHPEEAWAYLKWFYTPRPDGGPSPVSDYDYAIHNIPCRVAEAKQDRFIKDPKFSVFVNVLLNRKVVGLPVTPMSQFLFDEIERQREKIVYRELTPDQAMQEIQDKSNNAFEHASTSMAGEAS